MGIINWAGGLSAAGNAISDIGKEGVRAALDQEKIRLIDELNGKREVAGETRREAIRVAGRQSDLVQDTDPKNIELKAAAQTGLLNSTRGARMADQKALLDVNATAEIEKFQKLAPIQRDEAIKTAEAQVRAMSTPEMLKGERAIAMAKHIVDPSYTLIQDEDGHLIKYESHSGKSAGMLMDPDGKPVVKKDPEQLRAATSLINMANTNLKIEEAAYKASAGDAMADAPTKAAAEAKWKAAQDEAKRLTAPAYAVLYSKAQADAPAPAVTPTIQPSTGDIAGLKARAKNPAAIAVFEAKFGAGSAARYSDQPKPSGLIASGAPEAPLSQQFADVLQEKPFQQRSLSDVIKRK